MVQKSMKSIATILPSVVQSECYEVQNVFTLLYQPGHKDASSSLIYALILTQTAHPCGPAKSEHILRPGDNLQNGATLTQRRHYGV